MANIGLSTLTQTPCKLPGYDAMSDRLGGCESFAISESTSRRRLAPAPILRHSSSHRKRPSLPSTRKL